MTQISFVQRAPQGHIFAPGCFNADIGKHVPFNVGDETVMATLVYADVLPSGEGVELALEIPDQVYANLSSLLGDT